MKNMSNTRDAEVLLARSQLVNKAVITRTSGLNLGTVSQLWVDVDEWKVTSLDLRDNILFGDLNCVMLNSLRQVCYTLPPIPIVVMKFGV